MCCFLEIKFFGVALVLRQTPQLPPALQYLHALQFLQAVQERLPVQRAFLEAQQFFPGSGLENPKEKKRSRAMKNFVVMSIILRTYNLELVLCIRVNTEK